LSDNTTLRNDGEQRCSGRVSSSFSICGTSRVTFTRSLNSWIHSKQVRRDFRLKRLISLWVLMLHYNSISVISLWWYLLVEGISIFEEIPCQKKNIFSSILHIKIHFTQCHMLLGNVTFRMRLPVVVWTPAVVGNPL
jgi:hypothetical protein